MKKKHHILFLAFITLIIFSCEENTVETISELVNITDMVFKAKIIEAGFDINNDGEISKVEAQKIDSLDVSYYDPHDFAPKIQSLKGIEEFTNLEFFNCYDNEITGEVDFTKNKKLQYLNVSLNQNITSLNLNNLIELKELKVFFNNLENLDLTTNTYLEKLEISMSRLKHLNISQNLHLEKLYYYGNTLSDVEFPYSLKELTIGGMIPNMEKIDFSPCINLESLLISNCELTKLDISQNKKIHSLYIGFVKGLETVCVWQLPLPDTLELTLIDVNPIFKVCD
jgi:hypothetical protein